MVLFCVRMRLPKSEKSGKKGKTNITSEFEAMVLLLVFLTSLYLFC